MRIIYLAFTLFMGQLFIFYLEYLKTITDICLIWDDAFANFAVYTHISFPISVIQTANKTDKKRLYPCLAG